MTTTSPQSMPSPQPITNAADANALVAHVADVMDQLVGVIGQETELVRAGRLTAAAKLAQPKADLTRLYIADTLRLRASRPYFAQHEPQMVEALRERHEQFQPLLQLNLTVLATAHAVSEGIVRGVSGEIARQSSPQTYGASGRPTAPGRTAAPLAVSRSL